jgi:hypothetical protein
MENAFGVGLGRVRVHTDAAAASAAARLDARAFSIGEHIAFGSGEYRPGTMIGDALLAHELAHTIQQGASQSGQPMRAPLGRSSVARQTALEEDADSAAVGVVARLWGSTTAWLGQFAGRAVPQLKVGLQLTRCNKSSSTPPCPPTVQTATIDPARALAVKAVDAAIDALDHHFTESEATYKSFFGDNATAAGPRAQIRQSYLDIKAALTRITYTCKQEGDKMGISKCTTAFGHWGFTPDKNNTELCMPNIATFSAEALAALMIHEATHATGCRDAKTSHTWEFRTQGTNGDCPTNPALNTNPLAPLICNEDSFGCFATWAAKQTWPPVKPAPTSP